MITKIYALERCHKCEEAKQRYPKAKYIYIKDLTDEEQSKLFERARRLGITSAPLLVDKNNNLVME